MAAPEKVSEAADERAQLTVLEMLDLLERRIQEMRSFPARRKPAASRKSLTLVKKAKRPAPPKKAVQENDAVIPAKAPGDISILGKRQALGKSLLQLRKSAPQP